MFRARPSAAEACVPSPAQCSGSSCSEPGLVQQSGPGCLTLVPCARIAGWLWPGRTVGWAACCLPSPPSGPHERGLAVHSEGFAPQVVHMGWVRERLGGAGSSQTFRPRFLALKGSSLYVFVSPPVSGPSGLGGTLRRPSLKKRQAQRLEAVRRVCGGPASSSTSADGKGSAVDPGPFSL